MLGDEERDVGRDREPDAAPSCWLWPSDSLTRVVLRSDDCDDEDVLSPNQSMTRTIPRMMSGPKIIQINPMGHGTSGSSCRECEHRGVDQAAVPHQRLAGVTP